MLCPNNKCAVFGCLIFATIFMLAGTIMGTTGILTVIKLPVLFKVGSLIWTGILVFCMGVAMYFLLLCCGPPEFRKNVALLVICGIVLVFGVVNLILLELVEWQEQTEVTMAPAMQQPFYNFLNVQYARDVSRISTIVSIASSLLGLIYVYVIMVHPTREAFKVQKGLMMKERGKHKYIPAPRIVVPPPDSPGLFTYMEDRTSPTEAGEPRSSWVYEGHTINATRNINKRGRSPDEHAFPVIVLENNVKIMNQQDSVTPDLNHNLKPGTAFLLKRGNASLPVPARRMNSSQTNAADEDDDEESEMQTPKSSFLSTRL